MHLLLLLLVSVASAQAWLPVEDWGSGSVVGSVGDQGQCVCSVYLPELSFPADRMEQMQTTSKLLAVHVQIHINKLISIKLDLSILLSSLSNLTARVESLESGPDKYIKLDFELLRIELREFEILVTQLKNSLNSTSPAFDSLYNEIRNMSIIVDQLESYDRSNLEVIRIEFAKLQRKLEKCQDEQDDLSNAPIGSCKHQGLLRLGKPVVSQINADLNAGFKFGGWGRDSKPLLGSENMFWYSGSSDTLVNKITRYSDYYKLITRQSSHSNLLYVDRQYDWRGNGNNYVVRENNFYYQYRSPFAMAKYNMTTSTVQTKVIPTASTQFSYHYFENQNLDFAADESGLWVIYTTEDSNGTLVIGKINEQSFEVEEVWQTTTYKYSVTNAFMICGVLYATRSVDTQTDEIFYTYNTNTNQEDHVSIRFEKFQDLYVHLDYNPTDQRVYMFNNGYYVYYNVKFKVA